MRIRVAALGLLLLTGVALAGDEAPDADVLTAIDKGRAAFQAGNAQEAIAELTKAVGLIQAKATQGLVRFLPSRDAAQWELGEPDVQSGSWGSGGSSFQWSQAQRTYTKKGDDGLTVSVMISNSPQLIEAQRGMLTMLKDPAMRKMLEAQPGQKVDVLDDGGWVGMITTQQDDCTLLAMHTKILVEVRVSRGDEKIAKEFWGAIDRKGLASAVK
jgi:hypothetical protein